MCCVIMLQLLAHLIKRFYFLVVEIGVLDADFRKNRTISCLVRLADRSRTQFKGATNDPLELPSLAIHGVQALLVLHLRRRR